MIDEVTPAEFTSVASPQSLLYSMVSVFPSYGPPLNVAVRLPLVGKQQFALLKTNGLETTLVEVYFARLCCRMIVPELRTLLEPVPTKTKGFDGSVETVWFQLTAPSKVDVR